MHYLSAFDISSSGMSVEKAKLEMAAANIANANSAISINSKFVPRTIVSGPIEAQTDFSDYMDSFQGVEVKQIVENPSQVRKKYEPGHPYADQNGFVSYPGVNTMQEMMTLITSVRAFEANVQALNAARAMAQSALEIGGKK
jgi:flagellar basal-body rod protein FlgC